MRDPSRGGAGWYAVAVLWLAYICSFVDRQVLALLVDPIKASLAISDTRFSLLQGLAFGVFYALLGLPCGWLVDRSSRRGVIAGGIALWSLATASCGLAAGFATLFVSRMLVGVGEATLSPGALSLLSDHFPSERRALAMSVYVSAASFGSGLALVAGGAAVAFAAAHAIELPVIGVVGGWRAAFLMVATPGLAIALLMLTVREPLRHTRRAGGGRAGAPDSSFAAAMAFVVLRRGLFLRHFGGLSCYSWLGYAVLSWVPAVFMRVHGWTLSRTGFAFGVTYLCFGLSGTLAGGALASRLRERRSDGNLRGAAIGATAVIAPVIAAPLVPDPWIALALFGISSFLIAFPLGSSATAITEVTPAHLRGQVSAVYYLVITLVGVTAGPLSVALITDRVFADPSKVGWSLAIVAAVMAPVSALLVWSALTPFRRCLERDGASA